MYIKLFLTNILMTSMIFSCKSQTHQKNTQTKVYEKISEEKIISNDGTDTLYRVSFKVDSIQETEIYLYESKFKKKYKLGNIYNGYNIVGIYFLIDELTLIGIDNYGNISLYCFKKGNRCSKEYFNSWYNLNHECKHNPPFSINLINYFGIANLQWAGGNVVKIKQLKENVPEMVFARMDRSFQLIYEGELINKQEFFIFEDEQYNKFSNYLNQEPWNGGSFGGGTFIAPDRYSANKKK
jgi:hypothetical protein